VEPAHRDRDPQSQLGDQLLNPAIGAQLRLDAQAPQGLDLGCRIGGVAMALQQAQVTIIELACTD
jgi:hypothetical protein